jgi:hypothetical protein
VKFDIRGAATLTKHLDPSHRLTEFYDNYMDSYSVDLTQPLPYLRSANVTSAERSAALGHNVTRSLSRAGTRSAPSSNPSSFGGSVGSIRRRGTRRTGTGSRTPASVKSIYDDEEGYASGDYDDSPLELAKIRVKVHPVYSNVHAITDAAVVYLAALSRRYPRNDAYFCNSLRRVQG